MLASGIACGACAWPWTCSRTRHRAHVPSARLSLMLLPDSVPLVSRASIEEREDRIRHGHSHRLMGGPLRPVRSTR
eukprot:3344972-Prymnesium_polylepis.1